MEASSPRGWMVMPIEPRDGARGGLGGSYTESISSNFFFKYTAYVCPMISRRGIVIVKIMNTSIIFTYEVVGRLSAIPMWLEEYHSFLHWLLLCDAETVWIKVLTKCQELEVQ